MCQYFNTNSGVYATLPCIVISGVQQALVNLFVPSLPGEGGLTLDTGLVEILQNYPNANKIFFASCVQGFPDKPIIKKLVWVLVTAGIITHNAVYTDAIGDIPALRRTVARLACITDGALHLSHPYYWSQIPSQPPYTEPITDA